MHSSQTHLHTRTTSFAKNKPVNKLPAKIKGEVLFVLVKMMLYRSSACFTMHTSRAVHAQSSDTCLKSNLVEKSSSLLVKWMKNEPGLFHRRVNNTNGELSCIYRTCRRCLITDASHLRDFHFQHEVSRYHPINSSKLLIWVIWKLPLIMQL